MKNSRSLQEKAFTLIEILVVIVIIAVLVALVIPSLRSARSIGNRTASLSNLRQIAIAFQLYAGAGDGCLPPQVDPVTGLDWSGQLVVAKLLDPRLFAAREDHNPRHTLSPPTAIGALYIRSYAINSAKFTYLQNGYQSPWPMNVQARGARLILIPPNILLAGENFGGDAGSGAYVGVPESEGLDGLPRDLYPGGGACYVRADGSAFFATAQTMNLFRADTDYAGDPQDPWKWKP